MDSVKSRSFDKHETIAEGRSRMRIMQNVILIWLDSTIDESNGDCKNTITQLRASVDNIHTFIDRDECVDFLESINQEKVCMIISGSLAQDIVPCIHDMSQLDSILIFPDDKEHQEEWLKAWSKIRGVFGDIRSVCEEIKHIVLHCEHNAVSISFVPIIDDSDNVSLDRLDVSFMYTQILKETLLTIEFEQKHFQEFIQYCREQFEGNKRTLQKIEQFEQEYRERTPIYWYTSECFLYSMLNRALRIMDTDTIIRMGFFIVDLHHHIEQLHSEQFDGQDSSNTFIVYRGLVLSTTEFERFFKSKGGLMSFNNLLFTTKDPGVARMFAASDQNNSDSVGVLFVMTIDPTQSTTPFASVINVSSFHEENEVLFAMHSVFRIGDVKPMDEDNQFYQVDLTLTRDNDKYLYALTEHIRKEIPNAGWRGLGQFLRQMGKLDMAEEIFQVSLDQTTDDNEKALYYYLLALVKDDRGEYQQALELHEKAQEIYQKNLLPQHFSLTDSYHHIGIVYNKMGDYTKARSYYEKALGLRQQSLPPNHPDLATSYNSIGVVYNKIGDYPKALSNYEKALGIWQKSLPPIHTHLATCYNNIAMIYRLMGDYPEALSNYEKALGIWQQSLPPTDPHLAASYNNIGMMHENMNDYPKSLSNYEKAFAIRQQSLAPNHPDLAGACYNIGMVYCKMGDYPKALSNFEKALDIRQQSLSPNHPGLVSSYNNIGTLYDSIGDYPQALSYYEKALGIWQQSLPPTHPHLATCYNNIGMVYDNMGDYPKAVSNHEKALGIRQQSLPPNHPHLAASYNNIGMMYENMNDYPKSLSSYEKAFGIRQQSLPLNHPDLAEACNNIGMVYCVMGDYPKALSNHEKALGIWQKSLPPNHPDLAASYNNIGMVYNNMGDYLKALSNFQKALGIWQKSLPPAHPHLATCYNNIGMVYDNMGDYTKALSNYEKVVRIWQQLLPPNHPDLAASYNNIAMVHNDMGDYTKALSNYKKVVRIWQQSLPPNHPDLAVLYNDIGMVYNSMGDYPKALSYYEKALGIWQQSLPLTHPHLAASYNYIGMVYDEMSDYPKALINYEKALEICEKALEIETKCLPSSHPSLAVSHYRIAKVLEGFQRYKEAAKHASRALSIARLSSELNQSQIDVYKKYLDHIINKPEYDDLVKSKSINEWTYPLLLIIPSTEKSTLHSVLYDLTDGHLAPPIQTSNCLTILKSNQKITSVVLELSTNSIEERDHLVKEISAIDHIESIYLLGKPIEIREDKDKFLMSFCKVTIFCEDVEELAVRWALNTAHDYRKLGGQYAKDGTKDFAGEYFQRGKKLYDRLGTLIHGTRT